MGQLEPLLLPLETILPSCVTYVIQLLFCTQVTGVVTGARPTSHRPNKHVPYNKKTLTRTLQLYDSPFMQCKSKYVQTKTTIAQSAQSPWQLVTSRQHLRQGDETLTEETGGGRDDSRPGADGADVESVARGRGQAFQ